MAGTITPTLSLAVVNGKYSRAFAPAAPVVVQNAQGAWEAVVVVGTGAEEDLAPVDITTLGWCLLLNLDDTNYVTYGPKSTTMVAFGRLRTGEPACFRLEPGVTLRWTANTAACKVQILVLND